MNIADHRFLVTGGAGFIGSHVVDKLIAEGARRVIVLDNLVRGTRANLAAALSTGRVMLFGYNADIRNQDEVRAAAADVDGVFHLACLSLLHSDRFPHAAVNVNIVGGFNVFDACVSAGVRRLVHASSSSVYGDAIRTPMDEQHPFNNRNFYGATKIALEHLLVAFHYKYGLDYIGLRYMNVYGSRQDTQGAYVGPIINAVDRLARGERPVVYGDGTQSYDFVYVDDAVEATLAAMKADVVNDFVNVATGIRTSIRDVITRIIGIMGKSVEIEYREQGPTFVVDRVGDPTKAEALLTFRAAVSLDEGLRRVVDWRLGRMPAESFEE